MRVRHLPTGITRLATESRSQSRNRELALERVWEELRRRARKPRPRRPTRPTTAAVERRLVTKQLRGEAKRRRARARTTERRGRELAPAFTVVRGARAGYIAGSMIEVTGH